MINESKIKRRLKAVDAVLAVLLIAEVTATMGLTGGRSDNTALVTDYAAAAQSVSQLDYELSAISEAQAEDAKPIEALSAIMEGRPQEVSFLTVQIGGLPGEGNWIALEAQGRDSQAVQTYLGNMSMKEEFSGVTVPQTAANPDGSQRAVLVFTKGEGKDK